MAIPVVADSPAISLVHSMVKAMRCQSEICGATCGTTGGAGAIAANSCALKPGVHFIGSGPGMGASQGCKGSGPTTCIIVAHEGFIFDARYTGGQ